MEKVKSELTGKMLFYPWNNINQEDFLVEIEDKSYYVRKEYLRDYAKRILRLRKFVGGGSLAIVILISAAVMNFSNYWAIMLGVIAADIIIVLFLYYIIIAYHILPKDIMEILRKKK